MCILVIIYRDIGSQSFWEIGAPELQYLFLMKGRAGEFGSGDMVTTELYTELGFRQVSTKRTGSSSASMRKSTVIGNSVANKNFSSYSGSAFASRVCKIFAIIWPLIAIIISFAEDTCMGKLNAEGAAQGI